MFSAEIVFVQQIDLLTVVNHRLSSSRHSKEVIVTLCNELSLVEGQYAPMKNSPPTHLMKEAQAEKAAAIKWTTFVTQELNLEQLITYCNKHGFETEGKTEEEMRLALLQSRY
jgi:hypothetical protein